ncbi:hypothetical protein C0J50_21804 [Silurus asotus]|uniref:Uncharacterized protein n=1 Tax=Silurus asotus TaxID=30991 RepID=A0AAD5AMG9_SILAS|nr:hypothetical protein C0J50_21804 [Silurus asotus]
MADNANELQIQSNTAPEKDVDISGGAMEDEMSRPAPVMTEGDDSVFYTEEEEIPQQILDSIWAPCSGEPIWPEKLNSVQMQNSGACSSDCSTGQMKASLEHECVAMQMEMKSKMENKANNASSTDTDVHDVTAANSRIQQSEELSTPPAVPLRVSALTEAAQMKERDESSTFLHCEAKETGLPGVGSVSLEDAEQEYMLDLACDSDGKPFNHLMHAKFTSITLKIVPQKD